MRLILSICAAFVGLGLIIGADVYAYREMERIRSCPVVSLKGAAHVQCKDWTRAFPLSAVFEGDRTMVRTGVTVLECTWTQKASRVLGIPLSTVKNSRRCAIFSITRNGDNKEPGRSPGLHSLAYLPTPIFHCRIHFFHDRIRLCIGECAPGGLENEAECQR